MMDARDAIARIQDHNRVHQQKEHGAFYITKALDMAVEALEKQIPKKPRQITIAAIKRYECPICSHYFISYHESVGFYQGFRDEYCCRCGQRLDWENER